MIFGSNNILGGYVGSAPLEKAYLGSNLVYGGDTPTPSLPSGYTYIPDGVRSNQAPTSSWDNQQYIDTGINITGSPEVRLTYIGGGTFSDRIVGFDSSECASDDEDFRYFPSMCDAGTERIGDLPTSLYDSGVSFDITFGNTDTLFVYDNNNHSTIADTATGGTIDPNATVRIDMSQNWMKTVQIKIDDVVVWDGVAAYDETNQEYGMFDLVSQSMFTSNNCTVIGNV